MSQGYCQREANVQQVLQQIVRVCEKVKRNRFLFRCFL